MTIGNDADLINNDFSLLDNTTKKEAYAETILIIARHSDWELIERWSEKELSKWKRKGKCCNASPHQSMHGGKTTMKSALKIHALQAVVE